MSNVVGAIGKRYCILMGEDGKWILYDKHCEQTLACNHVDQNKVNLILSEHSQESREIISSL